MQALDLQITVHGWALVQVEGDGRAWCYTVGLVEHYGHPELTLMDVATEFQRQYVDELVESIQQRGTIAPWILVANGVELVEVHHDHVRSDLFGRWAGRYDRYPHPGEMLQIVPPSDAFCACHALQVTRLDQPGPLPWLDSGPARPNRATRRRNARRRG